MDTIEINVNDNYGKCLKDSVVPLKGKDRKPEGYVEIFEISDDGKKKKLGKHNLVVYQAREYVAERILNTNNVNTSTTPDMFISWLGVGDGGTPVGDPLNPTAPVNTDTDLSNEVPVSTTDTNCADYRSGAYWKKPIGSIEFEQDSSNNNEYLIGKLTITLGTDDANGYNLSEAGLFVSSSASGGHAGPFYMFSIVTFPTIVKDSSRQLLFLWYLYF